MKYPITRTAFFFIFLLVTQIKLGFTQSSNDHIFRGTAAARSHIDFDARGFLINGKRTFIVSAGVEYARIPHQLWYDRLLRLKRAGFNCIEIYTFWNFHEPHEGVFDFTGDHDLNAFLRLVKQLDMYAIVRVGPYYCAEWDFGGYPLWLRLKENLLVRQPNEVFEKYVDLFFDRLLPIVCSNQINHGGPVILVQLENEHPQGWGTIMPNQYFRHLQEKALSLGLEVPYFFSGLHHGSDPAGNAASLDDPQRPNPWFSTEFWSVWYNRYGSNQTDADIYGRRTWKIIAHGGNGYNYYMAHGGTNFGYTNNDEDAASYDYGAAVGQTGDLRPMYYQFKRNAYFARTFETILENSVDAGPVYKTIATDTALKINARHSENGDIIFLDNKGRDSRSTLLAIDGKYIPKKELVLKAGEIMPVVKDYQLTKDIRLEWAVTRIFGACVQDSTTTLVIYGDVGSAAFLRFSVNGKVNLSGSKNDFAINGQKLSLNINFDEHAPVTYEFGTKNQNIRIVAVNTPLVDRSWFVEAGKKNYVVIGPEYVGNARLVDNKLQLEKEHFWEQKIIFPDWVLREHTVKASIATNKNQSPVQDNPVFASQWMVKDASAPARLQYAERKGEWLYSKNAPQMGSDGDLSADAWYRTVVAIKKSGQYSLKIKKGGDRATVFVDNVNVASGNLHKVELRFNLTEGKHLLAIFTAHDGRDKLVNYRGPLPNMDPKGLSGDVILQKDPTEYISDWKMKKATEEDSVAIPVTLGSASPYKTGEDAFNRHAGYVWFQANIPCRLNHIPVALSFENIDVNAATIFINGKRVKLRAGSDNRSTVLLQGLMRADSNNVLTILIHNTKGRNGINRPVEVVYNQENDVPLNNWALKGGPGDYPDTDGWKPLDTNETFKRPVFLKNTFVVKTDNNRKTMWRVSFEGLGHGSMWINDHNIGRYPEKIPVNDLYIPECWLKTGINSIVVFDEDGHTPEKIRIRPETVASRDIETVTF